MQFFFVFLKISVQLEIAIFNKQLNFPKTFSEMIDMML